MITICDKNGLVRAQLEELSDSSIKEAVSDEEYASIQFKSNTLINFNVGDYVDIYLKRYWLMKVPAPIEKQNSIEYNYTIKFESSRAFLGYVNFELFDNTSIELVPEYNNATSYTIGNVVTYRNLFWQCTQNCTGISPAENDYWSIKSTITNYVPPYNASTTYTYGDIVEYNNNYFMYIYGDNASGNIPKEGDYWTIIKTAPQWDFSTVLTPSRYAQLIVDNMRRARPDQDWVVGDCVAKSPLQASFSNVSCLDAASQIAELFETELYVDGFTINFKKKEQSTNISMKYGENGGFQNITRSEVTESSKVTRLVALGGTQNILSSYRNGSTRLMLPNKYYIDSDNIDLILPIEKTVTWDNIFPCMSHATEDWDSTKTYYAGSQVTYNGYSWDALQTSTNISPISGAYWKISEGTITGFLSQYKFIDVNLTFNPLDSQYIMADGTKPKVRFITGNLAGYDFPIAGYEPSTKTITIEQIADSKYSSLPTASYGMKQGDQYVFIDLYMPQSYVTKNENRLLASAQEYLSIYSRDQVSYSGDVDTIWATNNNINLHAGDLIHVIDEDFNINLEYRIVNVTRGLRNQYEYQITLSTLPRIATRIENIENKLNNVSSQTSNLISNSKSIDILKKDDTRPATDSRVMSSLRTLLEIANRSLSRQHADKAAEIIDFLKGLTINGDKATIDKDGIATVQQLIALVKAKVTNLEVTNAATAKTVTVSDKVTTLNLLVQKLAEMYDLKVSNVATLFRTIITDYVSSETFISGLAGEGFKLYKALSGDWNLELDNLTIRKAMTVFELIISKIRAVNGGLVVSQANGRVKSVNEDTTNYILGIEGDMTFVADDLVRCQVFGSSGAKYYWVRVSSVSSDSIIIAKSEFPEGTVPAVGDDLVQMGNKTNTARQGILYLTASEDGKPRFSVLDGVNSTDLTGKNKLILGCLDGITDSDFPSDAQPSGYGLWAVNVFLKGLFILRNGKSIEDELNDQITAVRTAFEIREGQISSKVTEATVAATNADSSATLAQGYASTAGQKASAAAGSASDAANILTTVTQKETSINQTAQAIELKASRAESAAGRAESAEASINLKADGIVLQASNQAAKTAVDGVQVGGRNLILDSKGHFTKNGYANIAWLNLSKPLVAGQTYIFSIKFSSDTVIVPSYSVTDGVNNWNNRQSFNPNIPFQASNSSSASILVFAELGSGYTDAYELKLEEGNKATDWTPAPEDVSQDASDKANTVKTYTEQNFASLTVMNDAISGLASKTVTNGLESRLTSAEAKITPDQINLTVQSQINNTVITYANLAAKLAGAKMLYTDPAFKTGWNGIGVYNNYGNGTVSIDRVDRHSDNPTDSNYQIKIVASGFNQSPNRGGFYFANYAQPYAEYICKFIAWIPTNSAVRFASNSMGNGGYQTWLTPTQGQGKWTEYVSYVRAGDGGNSSTNFYYIDNWEDETLTWWLCYATVFDCSKNEYTPDIYALQSSFNMDASGISMVGKKIAFTGLMTFSSLAADAQNKINTAQSTADAANSTASSALASAGTANSGLNNLRNSLGALAYENTVSLAKLDTTIIEGGYIKTSLINANAIITNDLLATKIAATDITTRRLTVGEGCMVGGFSIGSGRIGISASPENIGNAGMFLYADMIGFNSTNRQAIVGTYSVLGYPRLGQFIDTTSNYMPNVGLMFDINSTNNGGRNYAFTGRGHGVLNGFMCGYAFQELSFTSANQWQEISKLTNVVGVYGNYSNWAVVLPTFASVCNALNISYNTPFQVQITVFCTAAVGSGKFFGRSNSGISGISGNQYPALYNWNADIDDGGFAMGPGDSFQIVLWSSNSGTSSVPANPGSYRAYIVNKLS